MTLEKKTAFVTGGAQGLGHAYVQKFLEEGANVFFGDVNAEVGTPAEQKLQEKYGKDRVMFSAFDVTNGEKFKEAFDKAVSHFGNIDVFVNNAGILNEAVWEKMIEINYTGTVRGTNLAMAHMRKDKGGKGGRIINISSVIGLTDHPSASVYCGTKHAVRSYSTSMSMIPGLESALGIEIGIICPDPTNTALMTELDDDKLHGFAQIKDKLHDIMISVSLVVDGLFSLLKREDSINGAILLVKKTGATFQKMEKVDLGSEWPIPEPTTS